MTKDEACQFLNDTFSICVEPKQQISVYDHLKKFYQEDIIGHYKDTTHTFEDIVERFTSILTNTKNFQYTIEDCVAFDNVIVIITKQSMILLPDKSLHEATITLIYHMRNGKAYEMWFMTDYDMDSYRKMNQQFSEHLKEFEINKRHKKEFLKRLEHYQHVLEKQDISLTNYEKEYLYYYLHGFSSKETAQLTGRSSRTIESYLAHIKDKLQCTTKTELRKKLFLLSQ